MTTTAKTKTLRLTSRAKSPKKVKPQVRRITKLAAQGGIPTAAETLKETLAASIEQVAAQAPVTPGLDGDAGVPAAQVGEVVKPAKGTAKSPKRPARKPTKPVAAAPLNVVLTPEAGWFHIDIDGARVGCVFKTTQKGVAMWKAQTGYARTGTSDDRAIFALGANRTAVLDAFVAMYRERQS